MFSLYADDLKIYKIIRSNSDATELQNNVKILYKWCNHNGMFLNVEKCTVMKFCRGAERLDFIYTILTESHCQIVTS